LLREILRILHANRPQRNLIALTLLACSLILFSACGGGGGAEPAEELDPLSEEEINGKRLWTRISEEHDYRDYSYWPGHEGLQPGQAPHGPYHKVFVNPTLYNALPVEDKTVPDGGIIVKENYSADEQLASLTVMSKVEGYNPEAGNWFWAKYGPDGEIQAEGTPNGCISCHAGMKQNDYVIIRPLDMSVSE